MVLCLLAMMTSCRALREKAGERMMGRELISSEKLLTDLASNNIMNEAVTINRIIINYRHEGEKRRIRANVKYNGRDSILLSLRTFAGIEAARILIDDNMIHIMDRINKIYYNGSVEKVGDRYGISFAYVKMLFGDITDLVIRDRRIRCQNGIVDIRHISAEENLVYSIDCANSKILAVEGTVARGNNMIKGTFSDFKNENDLLYPGHVEWYINDYETELKMEISNVKRTMDPRLVFSVGREYTVRNIR
ncbi:MAG: DUF4292 domain-containing protein [Bacteroidales bacterium]|nr:DUF4292 domain-containing protein [Bacteroidales bacterium]